jgi:cyclopropane-fatty-acyl-phospholipid synthase
MNSPRIEPVAGLPALQRIGWFDGLLRGGVLKQLAALEHGRLTIEEAGQQLEFGAAGSDLDAVVHLHEPAHFYRSVALGGSIGAAESFMRGEWTTPALTPLIRLLVRNRSLLDGMEQGIARLSAPLFQWYHRLRPNTREGSRVNIAAHYDLGNDFFALFLDDLMMYSCAVFERPDMSLEEASRAKLERICRKLELTPDHHLLEIGSGWGGFAVYAASNYGCRVTTTTISREQHRLASQRVQAAGLGDRVQVLFEDYRLLSGQYDRLVSIEMIEAVGHRFYPEFFRVCGERLKPDGLMLLQGITIEEHRYARALREVDFIQRYIFPGSCIPSVHALMNAAAGSSDLRLVHLEDIGLHYAETMRHWYERFVSRLDEVRAQGYPEELIRMWAFYLCYCEGGFRERSISDVHMLLARPGWTGYPPLLRSQA